LWHLPLILLIRGHTRLVSEKTDASFFLLCALVLPTSLLLGWLSRRFVEEPAIRWARRRSGRLSS
jgi:peptidoglycan/LPS O-acetylase OafA/YrhL